MSRYTLYSRRVLRGYRSGVQVYRDLLDEILLPGNRVLHLGCGHDIENIVDSYGDRCDILGVDPDAGALSRYPGWGCLARGEQLPFGDANFDVVISEYVLEHLEYPAAVFAEVARVLRPAGQFVCVAPNRYSYKSVAAMLTPHAFHRRMVDLLRPDSPREGDDVYPTLFRANSKASLTRLATAAGLELRLLRYVDNGPTWFARVPLLFELGRLLHALFHLPALRRLRCNVVVVMARPAGPNPVAGERGA